MIAASQDHVAPGDSALQQAEERLALLVQGTREYGIFMLDPDGRISTWNSGAERIKGYSEAEALGRHFSMFYTQEQRDDGHPERVLATARARGSYEEEAWRVRKDGSLFWADVVVTALRDPSGELRGFSKVTKDLTERRSAEQARQASEEMFRRVFEDAPIGVSLVDLDGGLLNANPALARLTGYPLEKLLTMSFRQLSYPEDLDADLAGLGALVRGELAAYARDKRYRTATGESVWVNVHVVPVLDAEGDVTRLLAHTQDISGRVRAQQELVAANARLTRARERADVLWRAAPIGVAEATPDGIITSVNASFAETLGYTPEQMVGMKIADLTPPAVLAEVSAGLTRLRDGRGYTVDRQYLTADGGLVPVHVATTVLKDEAGGVDRLAAFLIDMTKSHAERDALARAHEELAVERSQLEEAQRLGNLGSFTHDPVTGAFTFSDELYRIWGVPPGADLATLRYKMIHPDDLDRVRSGFEAALAAGGSWQVQYRITRPDGEVRHLRVVLEVTLDDSGAPVSVQGTHLDVTVLTTAHREAQTAQTFLDAVLVAAPDYTFVIDIATGGLVYAPDDRSVLGVSTADLKAQGPARTSGMTHPEDLPTLKAAVAAVAGLPDGDLIEVRTRGRHVDGTWRHLMRRLTPFRRDDSGSVTQVLGTLRDVTELIEAEDKLAHAALHDPLTGLPNRVLLMDRLAEALQRAEQTGQQVSVLFCDLDGFKHVNDTAGHTAGDAVLVETADRLRAVLREQDTIARVGGDEFVMIVVPWDRTDPGGGTAARARPQTGAAPTDDRMLGQQLAARVTRSLRRPVRVDGIAHVISASIGIAYSGAAGTTADEVLRNADEAMYRAKHGGKDRFEVFDELLDGRTS